MKIGKTANAKIPIVSDARLHQTSRGFLPWRFAYAGPGVRRPTFMGPPSANLHKSCLNGLVQTLPLWPDQQTSIERPGASSCQTLTWSVRLKRCRIQRALAQHSDQVLGAILSMAGRQVLLLARKIDDLRQTVFDLADVMENPKPERGRPFGWRGEARRAERD